MIYLLDTNTVSYIVKGQSRHARRKLERVSVYELDPGSIGTFDVVVCGSLLLHLRDPLRALEAIRAVCDGYFLSTNQMLRK